MTNRVLTVEQVADMVQLSPKTVLRAIAAGELEASQLARRGGWRVDPDEIPRWMARRSNLRTRLDTPLATPASSEGAVVRRQPRGRRSAALVVTADMGRR